MNRISSKRLSGPYRKVIFGVLGASALTVFLMAIFTLTGTSLVLAILLTLIVAFLALGVGALKTEILTNPSGLTLKLYPFFRKEVNFDEIINVTESKMTSFSEGFGYRILEGNRRGLLVGGSCVEIETPKRIWVVSCDNVATVIYKINESVNKG